MIHFESNFPYHYRERIQPFDINTKCLRFYRPSIEDLIVSKLYALRPKDVEDIQMIIKRNAYDKTLLDYCVSDAKRSALNPHRYQEMLAMYHYYFKGE